jgi:hypothetical protein
MKTLVVLMGALLLTLLPAAPAAAVKESKHTVTVANAYCSFDVGPGYREWASGNAWHGRDLITNAATFILDDDRWVEDGTVVVTGDINGSARLYTVQATVELHSSMFGDFEGIWVCGEGPSMARTCGSTLKGLEGTQYDHLKTTVLGQSNVDVHDLPDMPDMPCGDGRVFPEDGFQIDLWTLH